jgi:hypothetical protein
MIAGTNQSNNVECGDVVLESAVGALRVEVPPLPLPVGHRAVCVPGYVHLLVSLPGKKCRSAEVQKCRLTCTFSVPLWRVIPR